MKYVHTNRAREGGGIFKHLLLHYRLQHAQHICFFVVSGMCKFVSLMHGIIFDDLISCFSLFTRSYAADLDWIVGPGYSLRRGHSGEKPRKSNLEP